MTWDMMVQGWALHSRSDGYKRRFESAVKEASVAQWRGSMFCSVSGGKDSVALAAVIHAAGVSAPIVHVHTDLDVPGMEDCAKRTADLLARKFVVVEPDLSPHPTAFSFLASINGSLFDPKTYDAVMQRMAAGDLLVSYMQTRGFDGAYTGMRSSESRGRRMNRAVRGRTYSVKVDGTTMCNPIGDMSTDDVFAAAVCNSLPICNHYKLAYEKCGIDPRDRRSRVDSVLSAMGSMTVVRSCYPALWSALIRARPELTTLS